MHISLPFAVLALVISSVAEPTEYIPSCANICSDELLEYFDCKTEDNDVDFQCACANAFNGLDLSIDCLRRQCNMHDIALTLEISARQCEEAGFPIDLPFQEPPEEDPPFAKLARMRMPIPHRMDKKVVHSLAASSINLPECPSRCFGQAISRANCFPDHSDDLDVACACSKGNEIMKYAEGCLIIECTTSEATMAVAEARKFCAQSGHPVPAPPPMELRSSPDMNEEQECLVRYGSHILPSVDDCSSLLAQSYIHPPLTSANPPSIVMSSANTCIRGTTTTTVTISITSTVAPYPTTSDLVLSPTSTGAVTGTSLPSATTDPPPMFTGGAAGRVIPIAVAGLLGVIVGLW